VVRDFVHGPGGTLGRQSAIVGDIPVFIRNEQRGQRRAAGRDPPKITAGIARGPLRHLLRFLRS